MAEFLKNNFRMVIKEIEDMEFKNENIWVPIGILEYMFEDDIGYIDQYFHSKKEERNIDLLYLNLINRFNA